MSSPAGACCELAYLPAHQAMPTFVVGNNSGLWASVYVFGGRSVGTAGSAGAEYPRVCVRPVVYPPVSLTLVLGLGPAGTISCI